MSLFRFDGLTPSLFRRNWALVHDYARQCALFVLLGLFATMVEGSASA